MQLPGCQFRVHAHAAVLLQGEPVCQVDCHACSSQGMACMQINCITGMLLDAGFSELSSSCYTTITTDGKNENAMCSLDAETALDQHALAISLSNKEQAQNRSDVKQHLKVTSSTADQPCSGSQQQAAMDSCLWHEGQAGQRECTCLDWDECLAC